MKINNLLIPVFFALTGILAFSCKSDEWEDHYNDTDTALSNDRLAIVDMTSKEYMESCDSLSKMTKFFNDFRVFDSLEIKGQLHTLFVVDDADMGCTDITDSLTNAGDSARYIAFSHITDISVSPSNLYNKERLLMWHGKYVNVSMDSSALSGVMDSIKFNGIPVKKVIKTNDGFIYMLGSLIKTPKSLYEIINNLGSEYSIFKNMVLAQNTYVFDRENSKIVGVDPTGNNIYDSVFIVSNAFFDSKNFDLTSESLTSTVFIPSNDVINAAYSDAKSRLEKWDMTRDSSLLMKWILEVAFYDQTYTGSELKEKAVSENKDIYSIYDRQWRIPSQQVDYNNPVEMSNGMGYYVTKLRIPNNMLIYRIKDYFYYYESCTEEQKSEYFRGNNLIFKECATDVAAWTPKANVWPEISDRVLVYNVGEEMPEGFSLIFTPVKMSLSADSTTYTCSAYKIPPGEYDLRMGYKQNLNVDLDISVNDILINTINVGSATTFHYDRGDGGYPEGYEAAMDSLTHKKKAFYDRDGGEIGIVTVPDDDGTDSPKQISITISNNDKTSGFKMIFHHWCLRPTENDY